MSWQINKATGEREVKPASCDDPETWMSYEDAVSLYKSSKRYKGLSIALSPEPLKPGEVGLIGVDLDKAGLPNGSIKPEFLEILGLFINTYAEFSPTVDEGGLRILCYGSFPEGEGVHNGNFENYQCGKFLTITGHKLKEHPCTIENAPEAITAFRAQYFKPLSSVNDSALPVPSEKFTDDQLLSNLLKYGLSEQFKDLFYNGAKEGDDHSVKDKDLCKLLVWWTIDPEQIDRFFRKSALFREKWDKIHGHDETGPLTYGQMTINYVLKTRTAVYNPSSAGSSSQQNEYSLSTYPFSVSEDGIYKKSYVYHRYSGESEKIDTLISSTPCIIAAIGDNLDNGEIIYKLKFKDIKHRERTIWKTTTDIMTNSAVKKLLKEGMHFKEADTDKIIEYFDSYITSNKDTLPTEIAASVSGWKNDFSLFVVGNRGITANGEIEVLSQENKTAELYTQKGELKEWVQVTNKLNKYPAVLFKLYTACVPPLLKLLNVKSFVETQQTPSGRLKTTMGLHSASVWGNPEKLQLNAASTPAGIEKEVEFRTDLPIFVDETSITDRIKDLVYLIANGVGRSKSNSEGGLVMPPTWSTVMLTTGEKPILPESALIGQQVRVVPLRDGVTKKLPTLEVKQIQNAITANYGHVGPLFMQELFKEKDNLVSLFNAYFDQFPEVDKDDITGDRAKEYYAAIALAGYLLEKVFEKIGVEPNNPFDICLKYFNENVISDNFVPDHIKALNVAHSWYSANEVYFQEEDPEHPLNHERYGWIREDKAHGLCVCFIPEKLSEHLNTKIGSNTYEAVTDEWKSLGILIPKEQKDSKSEAIVKIKKNQISTPGGKKQVIKIPFSKFKEYLKLEDEDEKPINPNKGKDNNDKSQDPVKTINTTFKAPSGGAKIVNSIADLEKATGITSHDEPPDNIILVDDDAEAAEILRLEGLL